MGSAGPSLVATSSGGETGILGSASPSAGPSPVRRRTRRDRYPDAFKLTAEDIASAPEVPAVPPLKNR